jgi:hypothetical protein
MGILIDNTNFTTGDLKISQTDYTLDDLNEFINKYEEEALIDLLGQDLYDLFVADLDVNGVPQTAIYTTIYNPMRNKLYVSEGMVQMVKGFVWWEYVRRQKVQNSGSGPVAAKSDTGREVGYSEYNIYEPYNMAVGTHENIQRYINDNISVYPTFDGECKEINYWLL